MRLTGICDYPYQTNIRKFTALLDFNILRKGVKHDCMRRVLIQCHKINYKCCFRDKASHPYQQDTTRQPCIQCAEAWKLNVRCWVCHVGEGSRFGNSCFNQINGTTGFHTTWAVRFFLHSLEVNFAIKRCKFTNVLWIWYLILKEISSIRRLAWLLITRAALCS